MILCTAHSSFFKKICTATRLMSLLTACLLLFTVGCGTSKEVPLTGACPEEKTVSPGGLACRQGEWIYYINGDNFTRGTNERYQEFFGALCRMKQDGSQKDVVVNADVSLFWLEGERIGLCVYEDGQSYLATALVDGTGYKKITPIDDIYSGGCCDFCPGYAYYTRDYCLYRRTLSGEKETKITEYPIYNLRCGAQNTYFTREEDGTVGCVFEVANGTDTPRQITAGAAYVLAVDQPCTYYYMMGNHKVYAYDPSAGTAEAVIHSGFTEYAFYPDGYGVSYTATDNDDSPSGIFRIPAGGGAKEKLSENCGSCMVYDGGYLYYINTSKLNYLYRCAVDGSADECLCEEFLFDYDTLDIVDRYLYFLSDSDYDRIYRMDMDTLEITCIELEDASLVG